MPFCLYSFSAAVFILLGRRPVLIASGLYSFSVSGLLPFRRSTLQKNYTQMQKKNKKIFCARPIRFKKKGNTCRLRETYKTIDRRDTVSWSHHKNRIHQEQIDHTGLFSAKHEPFSFQIPVILIRITLASH